MSFVPETAKCKERGDTYTSLVAHETLGDGVDGVEDHELEESRGSRTAETGDTGLGVLAGGRRRHVNGCWRGEGLRVKKEGKKEGKEEKESENNRRARKRPIAESEVCPCL